MKPTQITTAQLGYYVGVCNNHSLGLSANIIVFVSGLSDSRIHGELAFYGDLGGGGAFHGTVGKQIAFTTCDPAIQLVIEWQAEAIGKQLRGAYTAICEHPQAVVEGLSQQHGVWVCELARPLGEPDSATLNHVTVFDEGQSYGPFNFEDFMRDVSSGRWRECAIIGLQDLTTWCSVAELVSFVQSQTNAESEPSFAGGVVRETATKFIGGFLSKAFLTIIFGVNNE